MLPRSFERAYKRLVNAFKRHQATPRSAVDISELGDARWELELARKAMATERRRLQTVPTVGPRPHRRTSIPDEQLAALRVRTTGLSQ